MNNARLAVGLDAGSSRTRVVVCTLDDDQFRFLSHADSPSAGGTRAESRTPSAVTEVIRRTVAEAERRAGVSIESVTVGVGGGTIEGANTRGLYEFGRRREIEPGDLTYAVELASKIRLQDDREVLQVAPQDFTVDGRAGFRNPRGVPCARLEANVHVITVVALASIRR